MMRNETALPLRCTVDVAEVAALQIENARMREVLEQIAWPEIERPFVGRPLGCRCGHKYDFCHAVNAARYCGGDALRAQATARQALGYYDENGLITPKGQARYDELREASK